MPARLSVNLNAIALLRNRRDLPWPSVVELGRIALEAGGAGLTVHPRPDERHTRFSDLPLLRRLVDDEFPDCEFNIEGYPTQEFIQLVKEIKPEQVTLVPDDPAQATSDHGWDLSANEAFLKETVGVLKDAGLRVSIFSDPAMRPEEIEKAVQTGTDRIELYTGPYGSSHANQEVAKRHLDDLARTASLAHHAGLEVNAGHDLTVANLSGLAKAIPHLAEVSIGHGLTADALIYGMAGTVRRFLTALEA